MGFNVDLKQISALEATAESRRENVRETVRDQHVPLSQIVQPAQPIIARTTPNVIKRTRVDLQKGLRRKFKKVPFRHLKAIQEQPKLEQRPYLSQNSLKFHLQVDQNLRGPRGGHGWPLAANRRSVRRLSI